MIEIIIWAFIIWSAFQVAGNIASLIIRKDVEKSLRDQLDKTIREVVIEKHNNLEYWFDKENDQFLGQGSTADDVAVVLKSRFPNHIFVLPQRGIMCGPDWKITDKVDLESRKKHYGIE